MFGTWGLGVLKSQGTLEIGGDHKLLSLMGFPLRLGKDDVRKFSH